MIDIHSHILPNVDDGVQNINDAIEMLRIAVNDGVSTQVITPHIQANRFENNLKQLTGLFELFCSVVETEELPIKLHLAAEVHIGPQIKQMIETDTLPWLGTWYDQKCFLLELPPNDIPAGTHNLIQWLRTKQITPILVHPERNGAFQKNPSKLQPFIDAGCPIQITSSSILGGFGKQAKQFATTLLAEGKVALMASDCHNLKYRPPNLGQGIKAASAIIGNTQAKSLANSPALKLQ